MDTQENQRRLDYERASDLAAIRRAQLPDSVEVGQRTVSQRSMRAVLLAIYCAQHDPTIERTTAAVIADLAGINERTCRTAIKALESQYLIGVERTTEPGRGARANSYVLSFAQLRDSDETPAEPVRTPEPTGQTRHPTGHGAHPDRADTPPRPGTVPTPTGQTRHSDGRNSAPLPYKPDKPDLVLKDLNTRSGSRSPEDGERKLKWPDVTVADLRDPDRIDELFGIAVHFRWADQSQDGRLRFFRLASHALRNGKEPGKLLTWCLSEGNWWGNDADEERALEWMRESDGFVPERHAREPPATEPETDEAHERQRQLAALMTRLKNSP